MKNNYFFKMCAASRIMFGYYGFCSHPVYATGGAFSPSSTCCL